MKKKEHFYNPKIAKTKTRISGQMELCVIIHVIRCHYPYSNLIELSSCSAASCVKFFIGEKNKSKAKRCVARSFSAFVDYYLFLNFNSARS